MGLNMSRDVLYMLVPVCRVLLAVRPFDVLNIECGPGCGGPRHRLALRFPSLHARRVHRLVPRDW